MKKSLESKIRCKFQLLEAMKKEINLGTKIVQNKLYTRGNITTNFTAKCDNFIFQKLKGESSSEM